MAQILAPQSACLVQHHRFAFTTSFTVKKPQFTLRKSEIVYGPMQRLPAALLSGLGKALTSTSIQHVFSVGGTPFLDLYQYL